MLLGWRRALTGCSQYPDRLSGSSGLSPDARNPSEMLDLQAGVDRAIVVFLQRVTIEAVELYDLKTVVASSTNTAAALEMLSHSATVARRPMTLRIRATSSICLA